MVGNFSLGHFLKPSLKTELHIWTKGLMNNDAPITISLKVTKQRVATGLTEESAFENHSSFERQVRHKKS